MHYFISRAGEDREWGVWVAQVLRDAGHETFLQDEDILVGHSFPHQEREAMERADHIIALLSPDYFAKEHTMAEFESAWAPDPHGKKRPLIPALVRDCAIPKLYSQLVYVDLRSRDKSKLLAAIGGPKRKAEPRLMIGKLPTVDPTLIGRDDQLAFLDQAWSDPATNFVQIIAAGGTGKTALVDKWFRRHIDEATVFGWSFYSQGTSENRQTSSDPFFADVLQFFGITVEPTASIYAKAEALARHMRDESVLLILDGIEPLQDSSGSLRDQALKALLQELATRNQGLVLCTTRVRITDVPDDAPRASSIDLDNLDQAHGAEYLRKLGVQGTDEELRKASSDYGNHALALTLLGTYLADFCNADVRRRVEIPKLIIDELTQGAHARHVMEAYARMFAGKPELDILRALGYFDRPAEPAALKLVLPSIPDLKYRAALKRLREARLILTADPSASIDCHPLIREYFAEMIRSTAPEAFRDGHSRLYEHYSKQGPHQPDTLEEMTPLFYAVYHGCQAARHQEALDNVYFDRIRRGQKSYLTRMFGMFGTDLSLLAHFFEAPWHRPVSSLTPTDQTWVTTNAAFAIRALGHLAAAVEPTRAGARATVKQQDWKEAAISYENLSELLVTLGDISEAIAVARQSLEFADRSDSLAERRDNRATLADALHQFGDLADSSRLFREAEHLQAEATNYTILYSFGGYLYCDLLLTQGQPSEVLRRATQTMEWGRGQYAFLDIGLDHLSLGRAHAPGSPESATHLDQAVDYIRRSGQLDDLPRALLARGSPHDLEEVYTIASRSGMRLYLADYHLAMARLHHSREHFEKAQALVQETGYHRRDPELAELRQTLYPEDSQ
jgi:tetratricopeptide (TPR) repeat protein